MELQFHFQLCYQTQPNRKDPAWSSQLTLVYCPQLRISSSSSSLAQQNIHHPLFSTQNPDMDALFSALGSILVEGSRHLCGPVCFSIKNSLALRSNISELDKDMKSLLDVKNRIKEEIELAELDGKIGTPQVIMWLRKVGELELVVTSIQSEIITNRQKLHGCFSCYLRHRLNKRVVENLMQVKQVLEGNIPDPLVMVDNRLRVIEQLPGPSIMNQNTASQNLAMIVELLKNDKYGRIGIVGMGGVGKTTLMTNLNNELKKIMLQQPFSVVIWVTISKDIDLGRIQNRILARLNLKHKEKESAEEKAIRMFNRLQKEKKFLVILDDVWGRIDLDIIGIPRPKIHIGCKILLTTRSLEVCREMETDVNFSLIPLCREEAWALFCQSAGEVVNSEHVKPLAEDVTRECAGLPLAILTVGRAMRGKTKVKQWNDALRALRTSNPVPYIKGIEKEVFLPLKWSYDSLEGKNIKPCFLYCCLYPEDFAIEINELLQCWMAEGLLDIQANHEEVYSTGMALIEKLKDSCLLESGIDEGTVRMHDVVRDVAIWIASSSEDGHKSLSQSGFGSSQIAGVETWGSYERVSYMYNKIEMLPDFISQCSQLSTLLLQGNSQLKLVPSAFLQGFQSLRVLNLSESRIKSLPQLENLGELRALLLKNCIYLTEFPSLRMLNSLQVLDLSGTSITMSTREAESMLSELRFHKHLLEFYVGLSHVPNFTLADSTWMRRLRRYTISLGSRSPAAHTNFTTHNAHVVRLSSGESPGASIVWLLRNASSLVLCMCECITEIWASVGAVALDFVKLLTVESCSWTGSMGLNDTQGDQILPNLEVLCLYRNKNLCSISPLINQFGTKIRKIEITHCHSLMKLFHFSLLHKLESLEEVYVNSCENLKEIITDCTVPTIALPRLRILELKYLPNLDCVCQQVLSWPSLKRIEVENCRYLKKLPVSSQYSNIIEVIKGQSYWWNKLEWENEDTKLSLQMYFQPL